MTSLDTGFSAARHQGGRHICAREFARLLHIDLPDEEGFSQTTFALRSVHKGEPLMRAGDKFHSLYVVYCGMFKTVCTDVSVDEQVIAFPMSGDLMGADGIASGHYRSSAMPLDTSEVVIVPFAQLEHLAHTWPKAKTLVYRVLGRELVRAQNMAWTLGTLGAKGRVAAFLLSLSARLGALGYSREAFNLRMTREEIGSYLGLTLETVSRAFATLDACGYIRVHKRGVDILDADALRKVMSPNEDTPRASVMHLGTRAARACDRHWTGARKSAA